MIRSNGYRTVIILDIGGLHQDCELVSPRCR